ncbi:hypothetical protein MJO28_013905 [Puccinia striiformis f. sp. tritici]|uniref:Svf1-like C-terminal domain-containing protein n=4 Tax=Puccinia striiformis TaxID=27350 RepID=A0A0L0V7S3_9BASI|nr:hypothetical protein Pst134EA_033121 [Puccinia striiformis f. sp. tritici]KAI9618612.1 hypothetical protein H4Q26_012434 [Puccinia striiformis f. sp. tritici PST-130]KNE95360.1 hypothetical protein PSTG_11344 [Puccinia striiformis f. sp. tritici PST-78]POW04093.1 hypothetical protein PSTT_10629 [Puccinia striiformis]KAH9451636.1 hypothetical protein Pst134EA_033121 [Puccinia striiformis f. sp. tritici]KAI7940253.1 hypothetical protein MJO28_013905 [Puccinia striiformis f. sp. tritici]
MSWFSVEPPQSQSSTQPAVLVHPTSSRYQPENLFGELKNEDTSWLAQSTGFVTETQTFYLTLPGGKLAMCQVIHSAIGLWYPQIQFTFRFVDQAAGVHHWKSTNVTNFKTPPPPTESASIKYDRRSCKADQFSILLDPAQSDRYTVSGKHENSVDIQFSVTRMAEVSGWKLGHDARGGLTYFGRLGSKGSTKGEPDYGAGSDGYLVHRFWPRCSVSGRLVIDGRTIELDGSRAIFVHAIQGMRPNLIASRWNFCNFQSVPEQVGAEEDGDPGVSLTLMEFTTVPGSSYGPAQVISIGSIVVGDKLIGLSCSPNPSELVEAKTVHQAPLLHDLDTGYQVPSSIKYDWRAPILSSASSKSASAQLVLDLGAKRVSDKESYVTKGLVEKVDVMAQIPYLVKKVISAMAGARPYIYTWLNPVSAQITVPQSIVPTGLKIKAEPANDNDTENTTFTVHGHLFNEATFISDI